MKRSFLEATDTSYDSQIEDSYIENEELREARLSGYDSRLQISSDDLKELENLEDGLSR